MLNLDNHPKARTYTRTQETALDLSYHMIDLPLTSLHYAKCGQGPPLIMVPATITVIENWIPLLQFMGQSFTTYFFELPGHGKSTAFDEPFTTQQVAQTVEHLMDALGLEKASIMGFSFGGLLTMKSVMHLKDRIERVILLAPAASHRALPFGRIHKYGLRQLAAQLSKSKYCKFFVRLIHNNKLGSLFVNFLRRIGQVEESIPLEKRLKEIKPSTIQVLVRQMGEVLSLEHPLPANKFKIPCYFAMSVYDPLLEFYTTLDVINNFFEEVKVVKFYFPYHQPKILPTFEELNRDYSAVLEMIDFG
ncbi:alpha/beta fold hydrolase [Chloroflexota bacterium]